MTGVQTCALPISIIYTMQFLNFRKREVTEKRIKAVADSDSQKVEDNIVVDTLAEEVVQEEKENNIVPVEEETEVTENAETTENIE